MKKHLTILLFTLLFHSVKSQDLIVTTEGDSIDCKITRITDEFLHFSVFDKSGILLIRSRLPVSSISYYSQSKETQEEKGVSQPPETNSEYRLIQDELEPAKIRLAVNGGYTYQLGGYEGMPDSYRRQMQSLWNVGGELHYFLSESIGIGGKYNHAFTEANEDFEPPFSTAFGFSRLRDEKLRFSYMAISLMYRNFLYDDQVVQYFIAGGRVRYRTDGTGDGIPFYQEGDTFGVALGVSYDFILMQSFGVGIGAEVNAARLSKFDNNGTVVASDFDLTRLDFTVGFRLFR